MYQSQSENIHKLRRALQERYMNFYLKRIVKNLIVLGFLILLNTNALAEQGLFWKAESSNSKTIYLFGTIHTDDNRVTNFSPAVVDALRSVDAFMMETQAPKDNSVLLMQNDSLDNLLTAAELEKLYPLIEFHVMHRDVAIRMKPWLLAAIFDSPTPLTPFAQDNLLMTQAESLSKEVIGIESAAEHFSVMDSLTQNEQLTMLRAVLKRSQKVKQRNFERLIQAYLQGDAEKLTALNSKITGGMLPAALWVKMRKKLIDERNVVMAERVLQQAKHNTVFVAVGASHLSGNTGLIARLKEAGYQLSVIKSY